MRFESPLVLLALLLVPGALVAHVVLRRRRMRYAIRFTNVEVLERVVARSSLWRGRLTVSLFLAAIAALCVAAARPTMTTVDARKGSTVVLVVDTSRSMQATDVAPTRLEAAKAAVDRFLDRVPRSVRVGLISFSDEPEVLVPPTTDHRRIRDGVGLLTLGGGTAIGDSLALAVEVGRPAGRIAHSARPTSAIVLVSDGSQTRGALTPLAGARRARRANMPVYTIALGTDNGTSELRTIDERKQIAVPPPDRDTLARIATVTYGGFFDAPTAGRLETIYGDLGTAVATAERRRELTVGFLGAGLVLFAAAALAGGAGRSRLP
ncbi:MAG: VWA domain-containing protein [Gaiellaceae bacterium]